MANPHPMTLEAAAVNTGAFVRVHNQKGPHASPAKIIGVEGKSVLVQIAGSSRPELVDPRDLQFWKARNVASNIQVKPVPVGKAQPIAPAAAAPAQAKIPLEALFKQFEEAQTERTEYEELEALCRADLEQATKAANAAHDRVEELRKQIRARIDV